MNIASLASVAGQVTTKHAFEKAAKRLEAKLAPLTSPAPRSVAKPVQEAVVPKSDNKHLDTSYSRGKTASGWDAFLKAFGTAQGDRGFRAEFDFDLDGEIGAGDFGFLSSLKGMDRPAFTLEEFQKAFGTAKGDDGFDARMDLDSDGEIGPGDFGLYSEQIASRSGGATALEQFQEAFGASKGDKNFNEFFDFDKDGEIGPGDFGTLSTALGVLYG